MWTEWYDYYEEEWVDDYDNNGYYIGYHLENVKKEGRMVTTWYQPFAISLNFGIHF
jgi:hypothetical protein